MLHKALQVCISADLGEMIPLLPPNSRTRFQPKCTDLKNNRDLGTLLHPPLVSESVFAIGLLENGNRNRNLSVLKSQRSSSGDPCSPQHISRAVPHASSSRHISLVKLKKKKRKRAKTKNKKTGLNKKAGSSWGFMPFFIYNTDSSILLKQCGKINW